MRETIDQLSLAGREIVRRQRGIKPTRSPGRSWERQSASSRADSGAEQAISRKQVLHWFLAIALCFSGIFVVGGYAPVVGAKLMRAINLSYEDPYNLKR